MIDGTIDLANLPDHMVVLTVAGPEFLCKSHGQKYIVEMSPGHFQLGSYGVTGVKPGPPNTRCAYCVR